MTTLFDLLLSETVRGHPLPWRIEIDWTVEVYDANNKLVIKCMNTQQAIELQDHAKRLEKERAETEAWIEKELGERL